jgi:STE24 endopeptidase
MNEDKATRYHRLGRRVAFVSLICSAGALAALLATGASAGVRSVAASIAGGNPALTVAAYVALLSAAFDMALLPVSFYRSYLLEHRYQLSTQNAAHWLKDHIKSALVGLLFAEAGALFVYSAIARSPGSWWLAAGVAYSLVLVVLVKLAPVVLLPLFYRCKPLERAELRDRLAVLASKAGARISGVYELTLSDRTRKANAALAGMGQTRRILLSDTLLADYSDDEIEVILAHELGHHVHRDIWSSILYDMTLAFAALFAARLALDWAVPVLGLSGPADVAGLPVLLLAAGAVEFAVRPLLNALSRAHERRADAYALTMTANAPAFISAMRRLGQQNLAEENPSRLVKALFYTHPPVKERVRAAQDWASAA